MSENYIWTKQIKTPLKREKHLHAINFYMRGARLVAHKMLHPPVTCTHDTIKQKDKIPKTKIIW